MRDDEKQCPRCAETIKAAAYVCRHCGFEFSEADVAASKRDGAFGEVDRLLREHVTNYGKVVDEDACEVIAEETGKSFSSIRARVVETGFTYDDGTDESAERRRFAMEAEAAAMAKAGAISQSSIKSLGHEYGFTERRVRASLIKRGLSVERPISEEANTDHQLSPTAAPVPPTADQQYGVLQGAANLAGGCATAWGILFLVITVILVILVVKEMFSGLF